MKRIPVSRKLFRVYALLFLAFYVFSAAAAVTYMSRVIDRSVIETQKNMTDTITSSISSYFRDMNEFSLSLMNSEEFKQAVIVDLPSTLQDPGAQSNILQGVYVNAYKMLENQYTLGVANKNGVYIWLGDRIVVRKLTKEVHTYDSYHKMGRPVLCLVKGNEFLANIEGGCTSDYVTSPVVTLVRSINRNNAFTRPQAILEVQVRQEDFAAFVQKLEGSANMEQLSISVFTPEGQRLAGAMDYQDLPADLQSGGSGGWIKKNGNMLRISPVFDDGTFVCYRIPARVYYQRITSFVLGMALACCAMLLPMLYVTYQVSRSITKPLSKLGSQLEHIDLTNPQPIRKVDTNIYELDLMAQSLAEMNDKLAASMQEIVTAQTAEMQSRLMALQSQIQPHFLHNTLAVIDSLSQEGNREAVCRMCRNLSQMLRYVSAEEASVTVFEEVRFLKSYVEIMQERFPDAKVHIDVPLELMDCRVPKLILQPLCENSFKHASRARTEIWVSGSLEGGMLRLRVTDNGPGFSEEATKTILARCSALFASHETLSANIDGMGLVNIYARLALFFHKDFLFEITPGGGITVGGRLQDAERKD